ncbi:MAG: helix-turn-helix transcriptional regulator [Saprospiraceae bacterium]|nr:helix-turn-helix transcriptional regulator [Bacteroidia bacterium]NNL92730.1 helix-turn-helix transcriptional regulator [Saprospiraceae bacterium]
MKNNNRIFLSERELEVLFLIAYEHSNKDISKKLYISVNTVDTYRRKLFIKLGASNAPGLIRRAFEQGILPMKKPSSIKA